MPIGQSKAWFGPGGCPLETPVFAKIDEFVKKSKLLFSTQHPLPLFQNLLLQIFCKFIHFGKSGHQTLGAPNLTAEIFNDFFDILKASTIQ